MRCARRGDERRWSMFQGTKYPSLIVCARSAKTSKHSRARCVSTEGRKVTCARQLLLAGLHLSRRCESWRLHATLGGHRPVARTTNDCKSCTLRHEHVRLQSAHNGRAPPKLDCPIADAGCDIDDTFAQQRAAPDGIALTLARSAPWVCSSLP